MHLIVNRRDHLLEVRDGSVLVAQFPVGLGRQESPTPNGLWTLTVGALPEDPDVVATLSTGSLTCLRATEDLGSLGRDASGG